MPRSITSRRKQQTAPLQPLEQEGVLSSIKHKALSGLAAAGNALDLVSGASSLRDILAGRNPFDQILTPFSSENRIGGRELLDQWGVTSKNKETGLDFSDPGELGQDVLGFGAEVLLSPGSFIARGLTHAGRVAESAGLLGKVGRIAGRAVGPRVARASTTLGHLIEHAHGAGHLDETFGALLNAAKGQKVRLRDIMHQPLGGSTGVTLPFKRDALKVLNSDKYNRLMDKAGDYIGKLRPVSALSQLFDASARGAESLIGRRLGKSVTSSEKAVEAGVTQEALGYAKGLEDFVGKQSSPLEAKAQLTEMLEGHREIPDDIAHVVKPMKERYGGQLTTEQAEGLATEMLDDVRSDYAAAVKMHLGDKPAEQFAASHFGVKVPAAIKREGLFRDLSQGRATVMRAAPEVIPLKGLSKKQALREFDKKYSAKIPGFQSDVGRAVQAGVKRAVSTMDAKGKVTAGDVADAVGRYLHLLPGRDTVEQISKSIAKRATELGAEGIGSLGTDIGQQWTERAMVQRAAQAFKENLPVHGADKAATIALGNTGLDIFATEAMTHYAKAAGSAQQKFKAAKEAMLKGYGTKWPGGATGINTLMNRIRKPLRQSEKTLNIDPLKAAMSPHSQGHIASLVEATKGIHDPDELLEAAQKHLSPTIDDVFRDANGAESLGRRGELAKWLLKQPDELLEKGVFADPVTAYAQRMRSGGFKAAVASDILDTITDPKALAHARSQSSGEAKLDDVLNALGFQTSLRKELQTVDNGDGVTQAMGFVKPHNVYSVMQKRLAAKGVNTTPEALANMSIPLNLADDLTRINKTFSGPEPAGYLGAMFDYATNLEKAGLTGVWPAFHTRNLSSGIIRNILSGLSDIRSHYDAMALLKGRVVKKAQDIPAVKAILQERGLPLTPEAGTEVLRELVYSHRVSGRGQGQWLAEAGADMGDLSELQKLPGATPATPVKSFVQGFNPFNKENSWNPLNIRGVGGRTETTFGPVKGGEALGEFVEGVNRGAPFIHQLRKGVDPVEAMNKIMASHADYGAHNYTKWEQKFFQRAFPFWKFQKSQLPYMVSELVNHPGGATAQGIRAINEGNNPDALTPEHVASTAAIPIGVQSDGTRRYLASLGLMEEAPLQMFPTSVRDSLRNLAAQANPLLRGPAEWMTGQSFYQAGPMDTGRPIADQDPLIGRLIANATGGTDPNYLPGWAEQLAANSPVSRGLATLRTLTDPRKDVGTKAMNTLTGLRATDVSPKAQNAVLMDLLREALREDGAKVFSDVYFPKNTEVSPESQRVHRILKDLVKAAKDEKKPKR